MLARVALAVVAIVVIAWLAVLARDVGLQERAAERSTRGELDGAAADLRRARFLNPDRELDLSLAVVQNGRDRREEAIALIADVARAEPDNVLAWELLSLYARDPSTVRRARAERRRLDPLGAAD